MCPPRAFLRFDGPIKEIRTSDPAFQNKAMSKPMRAKMRIQTILKDGWTETVVMDAVYGGSTNDEDNSFAKTTPSGRIELKIANKELHGAFAPGDEFYVDFRPIPKPEPAKT